MDLIGPRRPIKIFLGGCCNSDWRDPILLDYSKSEDYNIINPKLEDWTPEHEADIQVEKNSSHVVVAAFTQFNENPLSYVEFFAIDKEAQIRVLFLLEEGMSDKRKASWEASIKIIKENTDIYVVKDLESLKEIFNNTSLIRETCNQRISHLTGGKRIIW